MEKNDRLTLTYHPHILSADTRPRPVPGVFVRETATLVIAKLGDEEARFSKFTGRQVGKDKYVGHYALPRELTVEGRRDGVRREGWVPTDMRTLCRHCGIKADHHRSSDGKCPPTPSWGVADPFPKTTGDSKRELNAWDVALGDYWNTSIHSYEPMK